MYFLVARVSGDALDSQSQPRLTGLASSERLLTDNHWQRLAAASQPLAATGSCQSATGSHWQLPVSHWQLPVSHVTCQWQLLPAS
ncbi:hypothetical protein F2P79_022529 [Pimephales promelas]|nr:hypothetical protein F2P79_022529 [Pimephales promelas]